MNLRNLLKNVKVQKSETMQSYFTSVSQITEQLEAIGDMIEEVEVVMTTLNDLPRDWVSFIQGIWARRKLDKFWKIWEECVQEEERILDREVKLNENEYQALKSHAKGKHKRKSNDHPHKTQGFKRPKKYFSNFECFTFHKMGHIAINCPMKS